MTCNKILSLITAAAVGLAAAGCGSKSAKQRCSIAVSIPPQGAILKEITGDSIDIVVIIDRSANPESFEPSVADMKALTDADAYVAIASLPFEKRLTRRLAAQQPQKRVYDNSDVVEKIFGTHGDHADEADPHTWTSIKNLKQIARQMGQIANDVDPDNSAYYDANLARLLARLDSIDRQAETKLRQAGDPAFLIWHPSLSYFARDYRLKQIAVGQENKEMSVSSFREAINQASAANVAAFFIQADFDASQAENLARQLSVPAISLNPLDPDWESQFNLIIDGLTSQNPN